VTLGKITPTARTAPWGLHVKDPKLELLQFVRPFTPYVALTGLDAQRAEIYVNDLRVNLLYGNSSRICISRKVNCTVDFEKTGSGGDEGRNDCGVFGTCTNGVCMDMIDCTKAVYWCPASGFDYSNGY
jgi:hypothetical protein